MKLSAEQVKTFLRIQRKHNVSVAFILRNMPAILKFVQYAITPHIVLKRKLIRRRNRVFLRYNYLRKLIFDPSQLRKRQSVKRSHSQWSKRMVMYLRRYKMVEFFEDEMTGEAPLPKEDVSKQLKEQLELLKTGKRTVPFFEDVNSVDERQNSRILRCYSTDETCGTENSEVAAITDDTDLEELSNQPQTPLTAVNVVDDISISSISETTQDQVKISKTLSDESDRPNGNFLDMLISKVKNTSDDVSEVGELTEKSMEPPKQTVKTTAGEVFQTDEPENSNSSSDFFGFDDNERIRGTFPGMLSTPLVKKCDRNSAFVSETLNAFMRDNSLESPATVNFPQRRPEDGLVFANSIPPKLDMPAVPQGLQSLRTVAERRSFLQKNRNVKYCIINNVATIYRELQKRIKGHRINKTAIEAVQTARLTPLTRQSWKAATWLLTDEGNYYFQTITIDGKNFRLFGSRGNHQKKFKRPHSSRCEDISPVCTNQCIDRTIFRALRPIRTLKKRSKLSDASTIGVYKACPLSQKILQHSENDESAFDSLEIVRMPQVELEVFPQLQKPLNDIAKRYLQLILPYDGISREWAEFSVSTLLERQKLGLVANLRQSYTFTLPYANDRDHVLVRRIYNRSEAFEGKSDNSNLSFRMDIDRKRALGKPVDLLANECADVLTDMLNSVAISCSENSFIKDDPDNIYQSGNGDDEMIVEKSIKKTVELHQHQAGPQNRKQSRLLMELKRLNATIIDAAASKSEEDRVACDKECCKLGCVCASLNEGTTVRQHCGKQRCILDCNCKCPGIMRLETDGRSITTEDAFMLRRQATAKLARMEKEFTSTIVLTGSETLFINESQYDKKRRCTKIPKRYGDFVDPDESDFTSENKPAKLADTPPLPLAPIMVKDNVFQCLRHCTVNIKKLRDVKDLAPWCMVHMVYKCYCKGQAMLGNPIVVEKLDEVIGGTTTDETLAAKNRALYSFEKEESKTNGDPTASSCYESDSDESRISDSISVSNLSLANQHKRLKRDKRGRPVDINIIDMYKNARANHCRRVVPIPRNIFIRRNKKRAARIQLYIAEHETDETRLSLNEHVLRSVYYHKNNLSLDKGKTVSVKISEKNKANEETQRSPEKCRNKEGSSSSSKAEKRKLCEENKTSETNIPTKKGRGKSIDEMEEGSSLLRFNRYKGQKKPVDSSRSVADALPSATSSTYQQEQITVPKISQIFSLNSQVLEMGTDSAAAVAADIPQQSTEAAASAGVSSDAFRNVFQVVIRNMNNLVSKKMQDIDMALRRESKAIPSPNDEILCIIRWNNFLESFTDGYVFLWEVRTINMTFIAATIRNVMPLVMDALSVVNIRALPRDGLPLLGRMLIDKMMNTITDGLAVVMQGQKLYWLVKGFLRPDKTRICPKPTPETHPLLTKKINVLCRLLINQQLKEHKKRTEHPRQISTVPNSLPPPLNHSNLLQKETQISSPSSFRNNLAPKLKVLPMQRNISDNATEILEQMISLVYGSVRTNISFRKLRKCELNEIYQPAKMNADHHWLVLDLSNDFSHIFIPQLKDLLTLDRIQKVFTYAFAKGRIVKMQFCQKSLFNAYVTPMSRRKLYFGPFRNSNPTPQLVLLQSVDGQMMLREIYETRHNVTTKTDRTTAFWLIQKCGELFLDVESEIPSTVPQEDDIQEIIDDDICVVSDMQPTRPESFIEVRNIPILAQDTTKNLLETNKPYEDDDDDCIIIEDEVSASSFPIVRAAPERLNYTISYAGENSSLVVIQNECELVSGTAQDAAQSNFSILTSEFQPSLEDNLSTPETEQSRFNNAHQLEQPDPIPNTLPQDPELTKTPECPNLRINEKKCTPNLKAGVNAVRPTTLTLETIPIAPTNTSEAIPNLVTELTSNSPTMKTLSINPSAATIIPPIGTELDTVEPFASLNDNAQKSDNPDIEKGKCDQNSNKLKTATSSIKWNKNVTITKVLVDSENQPSTSPVSMFNSQVNLPALARKPVTVTSSTTGTNIAPNQANQTVGLNLPSNNQTQMKPVPIKQPHSKPRFQMVKTYHPHIHNPTRTQLPTPSQVPKTTTSQNIRHQFRKPNCQSNNLLNQQIAAQKSGPAIINNRLSVTTPRSTALSQGGITVRTPTAINTLIRKQQQQQLLRQPANNTPGVFSLLRPAVRPHLPTTLSSPAPRLPCAVPTRTSQPSTVFKNSSHSVFLKNSSKSVHPSANALNSNSPQQQLKRDLTKIDIVESQIRSKIQMLLNSEQATETITPPPENCESPQSDPLHISEDLPENVTGNLPQPRLPNDVKTVKITQNVTQTKVSLKPLLVATSCDGGGTGVKRNSLGVVVKRQSVGSQPTNRSSVLSATSRINSPTLLTNVSSSSVPQTSQVKGIPIELPRLKKFAIINSSNTTIITPPTCQTVESPLQEEEKTTPTTSTTESSSSPAKKRKIIASSLKKCSTTSSTDTSDSPKINTKSLTKVSSPSLNTLTNLNVVATQSGTEYGYFHANIEGLPKFVVKRVNEDFLIKVPNFNGILKLTGLSTVHNYLNQYTTQKCGKTTDEIKNLKWTFRAQDRTKLNHINKSNSSLIKSANTTSTPSQKVSSAKQTLTSGSSPTKATINAKPIVAGVKKFGTKDSIVLLDDE